MAAVNRLFGPFRQLDMEPNRSVIGPSPDNESTRHRLIGLGRSLAFVYLAALIMVVGSERFFWFWTTSLVAQFEGALFYASATAAGLALMRRYHVTDWWSLLLVTPVVGYVVEGVITPVVYTGGPFVPFFPAWFNFWHGILSFLGLVFGVRYLVLRGAKRLTAGAAVALGVFWGVWSTTLWLPENVNDEELIVDHGGSLHVLPPVEFAAYATTMTAVLIAAHGLIGFVWPRFGRSSGRIGRVGSREGLTLGLCVFLAGAWTVVVPWALPMFLAYCLVQIVGLRWHRSSTLAGVPSLIDGLRGHVGISALLPLGLMAPGAVGAYGLIWSLAPSDEVLRVLMYSVIALQAIVGLVLAAAALLRARRLRVQPARDTRRWLKIRRDRSVLANTGVSL